MNKTVILIIERDRSLRRRLSTMLVEHGFAVIEASDKTTALQCFHKSVADLIIVDASLDIPWDGIEVAQYIRRRSRKIPLILITSHGSEDLAIAALRAKVDDYFKQPLALDTLVASICRLCDGSSTSAAITVPALADDQRMIGDSLPLQGIKAYIGKVAATDTNVLITGETGTGKELVADLIHRNSPRSRRPFIGINCAAVPDNLLESELFGYERGAFTGAHVLKEGQLQLAEGGTFFFDEIGDMSPYAQAKILRAIEDKAVYRLGGKRRIAIDVRVIAATNQDLDQLVAQEKFRKDLYFRLNVARIHLPPLRERKEDIPPLCQHYLRQLNHRFGRGVEGFTNEALAYLIRHDWPGNVRELKNLLEAAFVNDLPRRISFLDLPEQFRKRSNAAEASPQDERERLLATLFSTNWNVSKAAQQLRWSRMTLYRKLEKYHIVKGGRPEAQETTSLQEPLSHRCSNRDSHVTF
jgi:DNA-binding NtrC family response regulator